MTSVSTIDLRPHQEQALARLRELDGRAGLFVAMGGGKTRVALAYTIERDCRRVLVVLPLSVASVWSRECALIGYPLPIVDLTYGSVKERSERLRAAHDGIVLVNYESYWREPLRSAIEKWYPDAVLLDEAHRVRHRGSRQARFAHLLGKRTFVRVRLALSGTPITNGLEDAWSLLKFIDPSVWPTWQEFERRHLIINPWYRGIEGYQNVPECEAKIASRSFQWDSDLPAPPDVRIDVRLEPKTLRVYNELRKQAIVELQNAAGETRVVLARIALTLLMRLQQVTSGFAREVDGEDVPIGTEKADATIDLIHDAIAEKRRVVVFARFLHDLNLLEQRLSGVRVGRIDGSIPVQARAQMIANFDAGLLDVMLVQTRAGSLGIDLASASVAIFYSVGYSLDEFLQAKGRLSGALRQRHPVTFYHMIATGTIDEQVYQALLDKTQLAQRVTDLNYALKLLAQNT